MSDRSSGGYGDLHSHLVPAVDDGARTMDEALAGVERMVDVGVRRIITTPHLRGSLTREAEAFESRMEAVDRAWRQVSEEVAEAYPDLDFRRGHEIMLDIPDVDLSDARLRLGGGDFVLVEWPRLQVPPGTPGVVSRIRFAGLKPIIAHPERYTGVDRELSVLESWRRSGGFLQVSYGSLVGRYGDRVRARAFRILERGWADYLSTDFHGRPGHELFLDEAAKLLEEQGGREHFDLLAGTNPARLCRGEEPLPVPALEVKRGFWERLRGIFVSNAD